MRFRLSHSVGGDMMDVFDHVYGMRNRGFSIGCQPMDGLLVRQDDPSGKYYDLLVYERKLSSDECIMY